MTALKPETAIKQWLPFFPEFKKAEWKLTALLDQSNILKEEPVRTCDLEKMISGWSGLEANRYNKMVCKDVLFPNAFYPIIHRYYRDIDRFVSEEPFILDKESVKQAIFSGLMDKLSNLGNRVLVKDLTEQKQQGYLEGHSPEARFSYYANVLLMDKSYLLRFYQKYDALLALLVQTVVNQLAFFKEVILQTKHRCLDICSLVTKPVIGIVGFGGDLGDSHNNGKSVLVIHFNDGQKVIYKPRSLSLEVTFNKLLQQINTLDTGLAPFKTVKSVDNGDYGWMEYIEHRPCEHKEEVAFFYRNIGQLICLLYFLNGKDFHHENIIAAGKFPTLIDLESLFHNDDGEETAAESTIYRSFYRRLNQSVQGIGILPQCLKNNSYIDFISADVGGVSAEKEQLSPFKSNVIFNRYRDDIYIGKDYGLISVQQNIPIYKGDSVSASDYEGEIRAGFSQMYTWVLGNKAWFYEQVNTIFRGTMNRYIIKPTFLYSQLLALSFHPHVLTSKLNRKVLLHRIGMNQTDRKKALFRAELSSLEKGDIPYFLTKITDTHLYDQAGLLAEDYFSQTPLASSLVKIADSSEADRAFQLYIIKQIFAAKCADQTKNITDIAFKQEADLPLKKAQWLELAKAMGDEIIANAVEMESQGEKIVTWIGINFEGQQDQYWELDFIGNNLYLGNAGIALFLGYLGDVTGCERYTKFAKAAVRAVQEELTSITGEEAELIGAFNGVSSYLYAIGKLNELLVGEYTNYIEQSLAVVHKLIKKDTNFDIISGSAGCMLVLINIHNSFQAHPDIQAKILHVIEECYQHICIEAKHMDSGIHWRQKELDPLVGFAHGNAGIIYSLTKYYEMTGQENCLSLIKQALNYERQFYDAEKKGWRFSEQQSDISLGWCNGTPGILASRVALLKSGFRDKRLEEEITIALQEMQINGFGNNPSLCHGDFGNLEITAAVAQDLQDDNLLNSCFATVQHLYDSYLKRNWQAGLFKGTVSYNLMVGLAGCGYALLQAYKNYSLPKILLLD